VTSCVTEAGRTGTFELVAIVAPLLPLALGAAISGHPAPWIGLILAGALPKLAPWLPGPAFTMDVRDGLAVAADTAMLCLAILLCGQAGLFTLVWAMNLTLRGPARQLLPASFAMIALSAAAATWSGASPHLLDAGLVDIFCCLAALVDAILVAAKTHGHKAIAVPMQVPDSAMLDAHALAVLSHELRNPLNAVIGFASLLRSLQNEDCPADRRRDYARIIETSGEHMLAVLEAALGGKNGAAPQAAGQVNLHALVAECVEILTPLAAARAVTVATQLESDVAAAQGDSRALRQILVNIIANAVKFSPAGATIGIAIKRRETGRIEIAVTDQGMGMVPCEVKQIGQPFRRGAAALAQRIEGSGLGLAICGRLAEQQGARIEFDSTAGLGTTARIVLAQPEIQSAHPGPIRAMAHSGIAVNTILAIPAQ